MIKSSASIMSSLGDKLMAVDMDKQQSKKNFSFLCAGVLGALIGMLFGMPNDAGFLGLVVGAVGFATVAFFAIKFLASPRIAKLFIVALFFLVGILSGGPLGALLGFLIAWVLGWFIFWISEGAYRARLLPYLTPGQVLWHYAFRVICGLIFFFLIAPIVVVMPLSFNAQDFFTFTPEMLRFDPDGYSLKHYSDFFTNYEWQRSFQNSIIIAPIATQQGCSFSMPL